MYDGQPLSILDRRYFMAAITTEEGAPSRQSGTGGGGNSKVVMEKGLSTANNLVKLLPSSTVLAFQSLYPTFSNRGHCYTSNKYMTSALILVCSVSCIFFSFTDSVVGEDGGLYVGVATFKGFAVFNFEGSEEEKERNLGDQLQRLRIRILDCVHAVLSALVFVTFALSESDVVSCFFPERGTDTKQWLENLPLGVAFLSSVVFMVFPTTRKGIGYSDLHGRVSKT